MVVSTALGPVANSFLLEEGLDYNQVHFGIIGVIVLNALLVLTSGMIIKRWRKMREARN